jgi:sugar O-acyltransferase (sialic acid O-acetyltransferase NeuD family)
VSASLPPRVLFGAGKQAGHVLNLLEWMGLPWEDVVLFDDAHPKLTLGPRDLPVLGRLEQGIEYCERGPWSAMVALGSRMGALRYGLFRRLVQRGIALSTLVHPSCVIAPSARLGSNVLMMPGCVVAPNVAVGSLCCIFSNVTLEHDVAVADNVVFGPGAVVSGYARIGMHAFLGAGAVCAPEVSIGERTLVGAGAVVVSDTPAGAVMVGVPARFRREVADGDDAPTLSALQLQGCG